MTTEWICWIAGVLILLSVLADIANGRTRLRGIGAFFKGKQNQKNIGFQSVSRYSYWAL